MQIHELNPYIGKPGTDDVIAIDDGTETTKIKLAAAVEELLPPPTPKANLIWYGTCGTAAGTTAKTVTCAGFELVTGATIAVKFSNTNTMTAPTLNVNSTGAVAIKRKSGGTESLVGLWNAGSVLMFTYDGTNWIVDNAPGVGVLVVSKTNVSSLSTSISDANITARHVLVNYELSNPAAQTGDWTVTTSNGSVSINGSISGTTDIKLYLAIQTN